MQTELKAYDQGPSNYYAQELAKAVNQPRTVSKKNYARRPNLSVSNIKKVIDDSYKNRPDSNDSYEPQTNAGRIMHKPTKREDSIQPYGNGRDDGYWKWHKLPEVK